MYGINLGGGMKTKGIWAIIIFFSSIGIYYYIIQLIEWVWLDFCTNNFCMKTLSLAEFLALVVAVISLYFVVTSLDAWKKQYQFNNTIEAMKDINVFKKDLLCYIKNLNSILDIKEDSSSKSNLEAIKKKYNTLSSEARFIDRFNELERSIFIDKVILPEHEKNIKKILALLDKVIRETSHEIFLIKQEENDTSFNRLKLRLDKMYEKEVLTIIKVHTAYLNIMQTGINNISRELNDFSS